jgi:hypothetical protein
MSKEIKSRRKIYYGRIDNSIKPSSLDEINPIKVEGLKAAMQKPGFPHPNKEQK